MIPLRFGPKARIEFREATEWIENARAGHGRIFRRRVRECCEHIQQFPALGKPVAGTEVRLRLLEQFPYQVVYVVETNIIRILAIAHCSREPGYWAERED